MEQTQNTSAGKGMGVAGFVISLVAVALWIIIAGIAYVSAAVGGGMGLAIFWTVVSILGFALSFMGFKAASAGGGKKGLPMAGVVLGLVAVLLCGWMIYNVHFIQSTMGDLTKGFEEGFDKLKEGMQGALDTLKNILDTAKH